MDGRSGFTRFFRWALPRRPAPLDAADVGTAFGMELSMLPESTLSHPWVSAEVFPSPGKPPRRGGDRRPRQR